MTKAIKVAIIAGERSGDLIGADLIRSLKILRDNIEFLGVGGDQMEKVGLKSIFPIKDISYIGPWDVLINIKKIIKRINQTISFFNQQKPNIIIIIDCPEFSHRVAKKIKLINPNIPVINLVSPTIWAWRRNRARNMNNYIDHVLSIFPFEADLYKKLGGPKCTYVGNPLADNISQKRSNSPDKKITFTSQKIDLVLMLGSRESEVNRLIRPCAKALDRLSNKYSKLNVHILTFESFKDQVDRSFSKYNINYNIISNDIEKYKLMFSSDVAIVASGSATLELAIAGLPMVVIYKTNILLSFFYYLSYVKSIVLPNIIHNTNTIPELLQFNCNQRLISNEVSKLIDNKEYRKKQMDMFKDIEKIIFTNKTQSSEESARIINSYL
tara:strand:- start:216 stop:1364 length:1149 start_codon:yes stop_codon:yes gene_type:complete